MRRLLYRHVACQPLILAGRNRNWHPTVWMNGMDERIWQVIFSPDGLFLAACSHDHTISIWETKTGFLVTKLRGHTGAVYAIAFSPDGRRLASGSGDMTVRIWALITGSRLGRSFIGHTDRICSVCYSPDGNHIASLSHDKTIRVWNARSGKEIWKMDGFSGRGSLSYSPDGSKIACCGDEGIAVREAESGKLLGQILEVGRLFSVTYSPNGVYLVAGDTDAAIRLWDSETLSQIAVLPKCCGNLYSISFSPDGSELVAGTFGGIMVRWNMTSFKMIDGPIAAHEAPISSVSYSPDGQLIASGSADHFVRVWDLKSICDVNASAQRLGRVWHLSSSPSDREFAAAASDGKIRIHSIDTGAILRTLFGHAHGAIAASYSLDGKFLASGSDDGTIIVWDMETSSKLYNLDGHTGTVSSLIFDPSGKRVISASLDGTIVRWDLTSGLVKILTRHSKSIPSICLSPDGTILACGGEKKSIRFLSSSDGSQIGQPCESDAPTRSLAFSPNGKHVVSGCTNGAIQLWDVESRMEVRRFEGHFDCVLSVAFSKDARHLLSASTHCTIRHWDVETGAEIRRLIGNTHSVLSVAYSFDGKRIISSSMDGTVRIWDTNTMQCGYVEEIDQKLSSLPLSDGWIESAKGELLLWAPPQYRHGIRDMSEVCIPADALNHPVRLDWSKLVKGEEWTSVVKEDG